MRLLLDTCTFLWAVDDQTRLSGTARSLVVDPGNEVFLSAVSAWEITLKQSTGRLKLSEPALQFVPKYRAAHRFLELPLDEPSALQLGQLPAEHKDPFDRMLICQAIAHGLAIVKPDPQITRYPIRCARPGRPPRILRRLALLRRDQNDIRVFARAHLRDIAGGTPAIPLDALRRR